MLVLYTITGLKSSYFLVIAFYFIAKIYTSGALKYYILSGVFVGLGTATKYYTVLLFPTIVLTHIFYLRKTGIPVLRNLVNKASIFCALSFLLTFFVASPYNFLDALGFEGILLRPLRRLFAAEEAPRLVGVEAENYELLKLLIHNISVLTSPKAMGEIGVAALIGLMLLFVRLSPRNMILLSFPVIFIFIANTMVVLIANEQAPVSQPRHLNVIYPFMALFAAYFINLLYEWLQQIVSIRWQRQIAGLIFVTGMLCLIPAAYRILKHDYLLTQPHTKTLVKRWVEANIPAGTKLVMEDVAIKLSPDKKYYEGMRNRARNAEKGQFTTHAEKLYDYSLKASPDITYDITFIRAPWWQDTEKEPEVYFVTSEHDKDMGNPLKPVGVMPYEFYKANGYVYAIVSREEYGSFLKAGSKKAQKFPSFYRFYKTLFEEGTRVKEFHPAPWRSRGPDVMIFKLTNP